MTRNLMVGALMAGAVALAWFAGPLVAPVEAHHAFTARVRCQRPDPPRGHGRPRRVGESAHLDPPRGPAGRRLVPRLDGRRRHAERARPQRPAPRLPTRRHRARRGWLSGQGPLRRDGERAERDVQGWPAVLRGVFGDRRAVRRSGYHGGRALLKNTARNRRFRGPTAPRREVRFDAPQRRHGRYAPSLHMHYFPPRLTAAATTPPAAHGHQAEPNIEVIDPRVHLLIALRRVVNALAMDNGTLRLVVPDDPAK